MTIHTHDDGDATSPSRRAILRLAALGLGAVALQGCSSGARQAKRDFRNRKPIDELSNFDDRPYRSPATTTTRPTTTGPVIPRTAWTSGQPKRWLADPMGRVTRITIHHDGMDAFGETSQSAAMDRLERIRNNHLERGWADIGYHYAIDPAGRIYQCRPDELQGAHVKYNNPQNLGILVMGNFNLEAPTNAAAVSLDSFVALRMHRHGVNPSRVYTHQELRPTECPGRSLQAYMQRSRSIGAISMA